MFCTTTSMRVLSLAVALLLAANVSARSTDRNAPLNVDAASSSGGLGDNDAVVLSGDVLIEQGSLKVNADRATVQRQGGEITEVTLEGTPVRLQQVADNGDAMNARANRVVYAMNNEIMVLSGAVEITQARGTLQSETVRYNLSTGEVVSGGEGQRVRMVIQPKSGNG